MHDRWGVRGGVEDPWPVTYPLHRQVRVGLRLGLDESVDDVILALLNLALSHRRAVTPPPSTSLTPQNTYTTRPQMYSLEGASCNQW